jgi:hypothetical protein
MLQIVSWINGLKLDLLTMKVFLQNRVKLVLAMKILLKCRGSLLSLELRASSENLVMFTRHNNEIN